MNVIVTKNHHGLDDTTTTCNETSKFIENCATHINDDPTYNENTLSYHISICNDDFDIIQNNHNIQSITEDDDNTNHNDSSIGTTCMKGCSNEMIQEVIVTTNTREDMEYVRDCTIPKQSFKYGNVMEHASTDTFSIIVTMCKMIDLF